MPRYILEPSARLLPPHSAETPSSPNKPIDLGQFWFNGYAVAIRMFGNGKVRAQRVVKDAPTDGVLQKMLYWLRTLFDAEGGRAWYLNERDGAAVLSQRMAEFRNASLAAFVPGCPQAAEAPALVPVPARESAPNLLSLCNATPALDCVIANLNLRDRTALSLAHHALQGPIRAGVKADRDFHWAMREANVVRTVNELKAVAARYELCGPHAARTGTLSLQRKVEVLGALSSRLAALRSGDRSPAARHLLELAAGLPDSIRPQGQLALLMRTPKTERAEIGTALLRDKAAYTALATAVPPTQRQQGLRALTAAYIAAAGTAAEHRASRWDELLADVLMIGLKDPALAASHFAVLASCLKEIEAGDGERREARLGAIAIARWHKLEVQLDRLPRREGFVLARALARSLWHFDDRVSEHPQALALLQNWQRRAGLPNAKDNAQNNAQDVALSLALLNQIDKAGRPDAWTSAWDRIEAGRLIDQGTEAARLLAWTPVQGRWQRVVAFCRDIVDTHPEQCADMLLAVTRVLTRGRDSDPPLHKPDLMAAIHEVALALLERGGPAAPLLQCRWVPKEDLLASIVTHVRWPARAEVLAQWLETGRNGNNTAHELVELLPALEPELNELVAMTRRGATDQTTDACVRALTALARRCDKSLLANGGELRAALQVAETLLLLVRGMRGGDTAAAVAALAQLVNSIALQARRRRDPAHDRRIEMLLEGTWALARRLPSAGRQAMLQDLAALKAPPSPPHDMRKEPHFWTQTTLRRAVQAVDDDLPAAGSILAELAAAEYTVDGVPHYEARFEDLHKRIWTKAMALPDHQFVEVAERIALWFGKAPAASEQARAWREARAAFVSRVEALPADPYGPARARIEYWTKSL